MTVSRRKFIKTIAAAGAGLVISKPARAGKHFTGHPGSHGVLHDTTLCVGCRSCEAACNEVNELPPPKRPFKDLTVLEERRRPSARAFTVVNRYIVGGNAAPVFRKFQCNHCMEPSCASACFVKAFSKSPEGAVVYNPDVCVGCRYCMVACPFYVPSYEYDEPFTPRVVKCTMCHPRLARGELPGCVESCPMEALTFGKRDDLLKIGRERIRRHPSQYVDHIYGEHEVGGTNWLYLAGVPFEKIGMEMGLGITPAPDLTKGYLAAVPLVLTIWPGFLYGVYAFTKRRERLARKERDAAVSLAVSEATEEAQKKAKAAAEKAKKQKKLEIDREVKKALEAATKARDEKGSQ